MYPLLCAGGYGVPIKQGRFEIVKITAACSDAVAAAQLTICDSVRTLPASKTSDDKLIMDLKRVAACDANIDFDCPEPIKIRNTMSPITSTNLVPGSIMVYIK